MLSFRDCPPKWNCKCRWTGEHQNLCLEGSQALCLWGLFCSFICKPSVLPMLVAIVRSACEGSTRHVHMASNIRYPPPPPHLWNFHWWWYAQVSHERCSWQGHGVIIRCPVVAEWSIIWRASQWKRTIVDGALRIGPKPACQHGQLDPQGDVWGVAPQIGHALTICDPFREGSVDIVLGIELQVRFKLQAFRC